MPLLLSLTACSAAHYLYLAGISQDINTELLRTARLRAVDDNRANTGSTVQKSDTNLTARAARVFIRSENLSLAYSAKKETAQIISNLHALDFSMSYKKIL